MVGADSEDRQSKPVAAVLGHVEDRVEYPQIRQAQVSTLLRQKQGRSLRLPYLPAGAVPAQGKGSQDNCH